MLRVMLVDDEPNILASLRRVLAAMPDADFGGERPQVETFSSPVEALARAADVAFDLVISDYRMPILNGVHFLEQLIVLQPDIARLILSGYADLDAVINAINRVQIFRFINKPWNAYELQSSIVQALGQRSLLLENRHLADQVRISQGKLSKQEHALRQLESKFPGLTQVKRNEDGSIELDMGDDSDLEFGSP